MPWQPQASLMAPQLALASQQLKAGVSLSDLSRALPFQLVELKASPPAWKPVLLPASEFRPARGCPQASPTRPFAVASVLLKFRCPMGPIVRR